MSDKKIIIRNCPAIYGIDDGFLCSYREDDESEKYCYDCTDCVMKQIVQECRKSIKCFESNEIACPVCSDAASAELANDILQLLDIQEIE